MLTEAITQAQTSRQPSPKKTGPILTRLEEITGFPARSNSIIDKVTQQYLKKPNTNVKKKGEKSGKRCESVQRILTIGDMSLNIVSINYDKK